MLLQFSVPLSRISVAADGFDVVLVCWCGSLSVYCWRFDVSSCERVSLLLSRNFQCDGVSVSCSVGVLVSHGVGLMQCYCVGNSAFSCVRVPIRSYVSALAC